MAITVPSPSSWGSGPILTSHLRSDAAAAISFLRQRPTFVGQATTTQALTATTFTAITLNADILDNAHGHFLNNNPQNYYPQAPGWYLAEVNLPLATGAGGVQQGGLISAVQNGGALINYTGDMHMPPGGAIPNLQCAKLVQASVIGTDAIWPTIYNGFSAWNTSVSASKYPSLMAQWVCANSGVQPLPVPPLTPWPVPPSIITSAWLNANIRDTINFLLYPPICEYAYQGTGQTLSTQASLPTVGTALTMDTLVVDNYSAFTVAGSIWTAPASGTYFAYCCLCADVSGSTAVAACPGLTIKSSYYNGGTQFTWWAGPIPCSVGAGHVWAHTMKRRLRLNKGDTVIPAAFFHDSASGTMVTNGANPWSCRFIMVWQGV